MGIEMFVYITPANDAGVGDWFCPPILEEELLERIGVGAGQCVIRRTELPFQCGPDISISDLNYICAMAETCNPMVLRYKGQLVERWFQSDRELLESALQIVVFSGSNMEELARTFVKTEYFGHVPNCLLDHIDYKGFAGELAQRKQFLVEPDCIFQYPA